MQPMDILSWSLCFFVSFWFLRFKAWSRIATFMDDDICHLTSLKNPFELNRTLCPVACKQSSKTCYVHRNRCFKSVAQPVESFLKFECEVCLFKQLQKRRKFSIWLYFFMYVTRLSSDPPFNNLMMFRSDYIIGEQILTILFVLQKCAPQ